MQSDSPPTPARCYKMEDFVRYVPPDDKHKVDPRPTQQLSIQVTKGTTFNDDLSVLNATKSFKLVDQLSETDLNSPAKSQFKNSPLISSPLFKSPAASPSMVSPPPSTFKSVDTSVPLYFGTIFKFKDPASSKTDEEDGILDKVLKVSSTSSLKSDIIIPDVGIVCYSPNEDNVVDMLSTIMMMNHLGRNLDSTEEFTQFVFEPPEMSTKDEFANWECPSKASFLVWNPVQEKDFYVMHYGPCRAKDGEKDTIKTRELWFIYSIHKATHSLNDFINERTSAVAQLEASEVDLLHQ